MSHGTLWLVLLILYTCVQAAYLLSLFVVGYFYTRPIDWITSRDVAAESSQPGPPILLLYPVLREAEETMRTTLLTVKAAIDAYAPSKAIVVSIPNSDDDTTIASLERLTREFDFLEILRVPPTSNADWASVWADWEVNGNAYWWHHGKRRGITDLPPKKTRQLIYALYGYAASLPGDDWLLSYLDADSAVPLEYFKIAAAGSRKYDVIQLTNVAGNLLDTWASTFHSMDHMAWDGGLYPHMSAHGKQPFYVLGKGLFYRVRDLVDFGGFHPWLTIEDPEVGMRLWTNGKRLGVSNVPLIEEVPRTFGGGVTQRKRWVAGFFQSLHTPLVLMGMNFRQRFKARLNFVPCLALVLNAVGLPLGLWVLIEAILGRSPLNLGIVVLSVINVIAAIVVLGRVYGAAWSRSGLVLGNKRDRLHFMFRVNPVFLISYWLFWIVSLAIGFSMFVRDRGLAWQRTEKIDANHTLVRSSAEYVGEGGSHPAEVQPSTGLTQR